MLLRPLFVAVCLAATAMASPSAQSDLDALMQRVLARRDENWKKLQQYTLNERQKLQITALAVFRLYGFEREYLWFPRAGFFIRSPLEADGVKISEDERRRAEDRWLRRSQNQEQRVQRRRANGEAEPDTEREPCNLQVGNECFAEASEPGGLELDGVEDMVRQSFEPEFIQSANFLRFKFDQGQYALVGREKMLEREVLKVEYYPKILFRNDDDDRRRKDGKPRTAEDEKARKVERDFEEDVNKTSLVTLWVDPVEQQILRYEFRNVDMDFLPARWLVRINSWRGTMQMAEPFPKVWLPDAVDMRFRMTLAAGPFEGRYNIRYSNYRLPETSGRVVP